ncbi:hypothetical protein FRUB_08532 [Fimbriiglobus ruber]|uniref:Uncharacterized protein n=1 Tax=Fimbriiglobus ruber TaxID=1908690 RepID=A0A225DFN8_9BACT|nr:hypothetical protein FRUB_08532 [Fimbriiglobus ruber]
MTAPAEPTEQSSPWETEAPSAVVKSPRKAPPKNKKKKSKLALILGAVAGVLFLGCTGVSAAVYFAVIQPALRAARDIQSQPQKDAVVNDDPTTVDGAVAALASPDGDLRVKGLAVLAAAPREAGKLVKVSSALHAYADKNSEFKSTSADAFLKAVERWGTATNTPDLEALIPAPPDPAPVWERAARQLFNIEPPRAAERVVARALAPKADESAAGLVKEFRVYSQPAIVHRVNDPDSGVRGRAERLLKEVFKLPAAQYENELLRQSLSDLAVDSVPTVTSAADHLAEVGRARAQDLSGSPTVFPELIATAKRLGKPVPAPVIVAATVWCQKTDALTLAGLLKLAGPDGVSAVTDKLAKLKNPTTYPVLIAALADSEGGFEYLALKSIGADAAKALEKGKTDPNEKVRRQCQNLLAFILANGGTMTPPSTAVTTTTVPVGPLAAALAKLAAAKTEVDIAAALDAIAKIDPTSASDAERASTVKTLVPQVNKTSGDAQTSAANAITVWADKKNADQLASAIAQQPICDWNNALKNLGQWKLPATVASIIAATVVPSNSDAAVAAIKAFGPIAEPEVLKQFTFARGTNSTKLVAMCHMLEAIGTAKSLPQLEALYKLETTRKKMILDVKTACEKALKAVKTRAKK